MTAGNISDAASQIAGEVLGTGAPTPDRSGTFKLAELFGEASIPLLKNLPMAESLSLELGYRRTEFTTTTSQKYGTYKAGAEWAPVKMLRFRGMLQAATRAPNINELYAPLVTGLSNLAVDPCQLALTNQAQGNTPGTLSNLCRLTGVPLNVLGSLSSPSAGQINSASGGNPNLKPEEAKTKTLGFVIEPVPKLSLSLDYYQIDIDKAVSSPSTTDILDDCYKADRNPGLVFNQACSQVQRSTLTGTFNGVDALGVLTPLSNQGKQATRGFDLNVNYIVALKDLGADPKMGSLNVAFAANQVTSYTFQATPASINRDCLGYYSVACGAPNFKRKFNQRTTWNVADLSLSYNVRYMSEVAVEPLAGTFLPAYSSIDAYAYLDLSAVWNVTKNIRLNFSVVNATDKKPPAVGATIGSTATNSGNTFPQTYDAVGRYFSVGGTLKF
jgi:outer membrane receptor protein involved in Fe transport